MELALTILIWVLIATLAAPFVIWGIIALIAIIAAFIND